MYAARCRNSTGFNSERNTFPDTAPGVPVAAESTSPMARLLLIAVHSWLVSRSLRSLTKSPRSATARTHDRRPEKAEHHKQPAQGESVYRPGTAPAHRPAQALRAPLPYGQGSPTQCRPGMFCAAPPGHLVVPTGETAALPWMHDRMEQPAARAATARHSAGLGARLPMR